jgi:hypothetical protein
MRTIHTVLVAALLMVADTSVNADGALPESPECALDGLPRGGGGSRSMPLFEGQKGWIHAEPETGERVTWRKPWQAPTMVQTGPDVWEPEGAPIAHKTPARVVKQMLRHTGHGNYSGVLEVEIEGGKHVVIGLRSFTYRPYWACSLRKTLPGWQTNLWEDYGGKFVAKVPADLKPVNRQGQWVGLKKNQYLLCESNVHTGHEAVKGEIVDCTVLNAKGHPEEYVSVPIERVTVVY